MQNGDDYESESDENAMPEDTEKVDDDADNKELNENPDGKAVLSPLFSL